MIVHYKLSNTNHVGGFLEDAIEAFWSPDLRNETLRSPKRMEAALRSFLPPNPLKQSSDEWGEALRLLTKMAKWPVVAVLFGLDALRICDKTYTSVRQRIGFVAPKGRRHEG